jgi:hypothetical protein
MVRQAVLWLMLSSLPKVRVQVKVSDLAIKEETIEAGARGIAAIPVRRQDEGRQLSTPFPSTMPTDCATYECENGHLFDDKN